MRAKREMAVIEDSRFRDHRGPTGHPERPARLAAVEAAVNARADSITRMEPRSATTDEILRIHSRGHIDAIARSVQNAPTRLDPDTYVSADSFEVARLAVGGTVDLSLRVARRELATGLAAVRPPGHHAESDRAMGFCLFNNVAIAARALQHEAGVERVLILDWDVHHGNGTQHSFETDPSVLYASIHQYPFYPGTGSAGESGVGRGEGFTLNVPLPSGCGDSDYLGVMQHLIAPAALAFEPEVILISCGFDAHGDDPLAGMGVTRGGYRDMTSIVRALADELCEGRLVFVLEGGYAESGLREGVDAVLATMLAPEAAEPAKTVPVLSNSVLESVITQVQQVHGPAFRALKAR